MKTIRTARLLLEPLTVAHAPAMFELLRDPEIYRYLDYGPPPDVEHVRRVYAQLETRRSPDAREEWLNWIVMREEPIGLVQATINEERSAEIAYLFAPEHWGHGYAAEAVGAMMRQLVEAYGVRAFTATVDRANDRSIRLLEEMKTGQAGSLPRVPLTINFD